MGIGLVRGISIRIGRGICVKDRFREKDKYRDRDRDRCRVKDKYNDRERDRSRG